MTSVLFLCTGNSCRSQMAEGWAKALLDHSVEVYSAGIESHGLNPFAVQVMKEVGVDISSQKSQTVDEVPWQSMDVIVSVCSHADENCPALPSNARKVHAPFPDPPKEAAKRDSDSDKLDEYRKVRDQIKKFIEESLDLS